MPIGWKDDVVGGEIIHIGRRKITDHEAFYRPLPRSMGGSWPDPKAKKARRRVRPATCPTDGAAVDLTVYVSLPRTPSEPARLESLGGEQKACRECHHVYSIATKREQAAS